MFRIRYKDLKLILSKSAKEELFKYGCTLEDCKKILEEGYDAPRKRKGDVVEKWFDRGNKIYNCVIVKDHNEIIQEDVWVIIHLGKFGRKRK